MCGIFGFVSKTSLPTETILSGLKTLEYRGYDSWGVAVKNGPTLEIDKHTGKIGLAKTTLPKSSLAVGHTRWATHGGVTINNSHPHLDCSKQLAVVHNGIFENYEEKKAQLIKKGHTFLSETDTEVIVHLIEDHLRSNGFATAVKNTFNEMEGLNAIVVINSKSKQIIAAKNGSPLLIGIGEDECFVSSDISALSSVCNEIVVLDDNQMVILDEKLQLLSLPTGTKMSPKIERLENTVTAVSKGKFKHFLIKEIHDQPEIIRDVKKNKEVSKLSEYIKSAHGTFFLGCGTASYAALAGVYLFSKIVKKHVNFAVGSEFSYIQDAIGKKSLVVPISQSGETIDVIEPVKDAKRKGATIAPIVNVATSTLSRMGEFSVYLNAGQEKAVVGTKSFTAMVAILYYCAKIASGKKREGELLLEKAAVDIANILDPNSLSKIQKLAKKLKDIDHAFSIGRGLSYVAALEAALKLKETSLIHAEGFAGGELKHGVIALIEKGTPCLVFAPNDETYSAIISNAQEIKARGGYIIGIGPKQNSVFDDFLKTADLAEGTLISQVVYMQLLAYFLALERGIEDPDKPRNLAKSVTVK